MSCTRCRRATAPFPDTELCGFDVKKEVAGCDEAFFVWLAEAHRLERIKTVVPALDADLRALVTKFIEEHPVQAQKGKK